MKIIGTLWALAFTPWFANSTLNLVSFIGICAGSYFVASVMKAICGQDIKERG